MLIVYCIAIVFYCHGFVCKCTLVGASGLKAINKKLWTWTLNYIEVTSTAWRLKWPEIGLFVQQHIFKKNQSSVLLVLCAWVRSVTVGFPSQSARNVESFSVSWHHNSTHLHVSPAHVDYVTVEDVPVLLVEIHPFFHQGFRDVTVIETVTTVTSGHASACKFIQNNSNKLNMEIVLSWPDANVSTKKCKYKFSEFSPTVYTDRLLLSGI